MIGVIPKMDLSVGEWEIYFSPDKGSDERSRPLLYYIF